MSIEVLPFKSKHLREALVTVFIGWLIILIINLVLGSILGLGALGFGAATSILGQ
ncbi:MAG: hypothetical protein MUO62_10560 [Anaerolineales bacterium]|nr:hypothetical protein [Anaerolineales bacterium]